MKKHVIGLSIISIVFGVLIAHAQKPGEKKKIVYKGTSYLFGGQYGNGRISKKAFDSLIGYGLVAKDTSGQLHPVSRFTFVYAERGAYEDSTGKLRIMADYYSVESDAGKLPEFWIKSLKERTKRGDTAFFSEIWAPYTDSAKAHFRAEPLRLIITD